MEDLNFEEALLDDAGMQIEEGGNTETAVDSSMSNTLEETLKSMESFGIEMPDALPDVNPYDVIDPVSDHSDVENASNGGGCDACRSVCIYNAGAGWKSSDYGYSD